MCNKSIQVQLLHDMQAWELSQAKRPYMRQQDPVDSLAMAD